MRIHVSIKFEGHVNKLQLRTLQDILGYESITQDLLQNFVQPELPNPRDYMDDEDFFEYLATLYQDKKVPISSLYTQYISMYPDNFAKMTPVKLTRALRSRGIISEAFSHRIGRVVIKCVLILRNPKSTPNTKEVRF